VENTDGHLPQQVTTPLSSVCPGSVT